MKWLKSTTQKSYKFDGKVIPPCVTKDNLYLALTNDQYTAFLKNNVIKSLVEAGSIFVTDKEPVSDTVKVSSLTREKAELIRRNTELQEQVRELSNSEDKVRADTAEAALAAANEKIAALEASNATLEANYAALKQEAEETIASLSSEEA